MKTQAVLFAIICSFFAMHGQNRTIVSTTNSEISDNLDLRVVASIFGDSKNLNDFERKLNDPDLQISNLDLNSDNRVDYLRVIESVEKNTHVVIIQSVIDRDLYQDVATIEVEKDRYNSVHIQVVGNTYLYGHNYIYEPIFYNTPYIYASFWTPYYRPYYSSWTWNYYPSYYYAWNPYPVNRYRYNVNNCINIHNNYNYVNYRRSSIAVNIYKTKYSNGYEKQHPNYSFSRRNEGINNRYEFDQKRNSRNTETRTKIGYSQNRTNNSTASREQNKVNLSSYPQSRAETSNKVSPHKNVSSRSYLEAKVESTNSSSAKRNESSRSYSQTRVEPINTSLSKRNVVEKDKAQSRNSSTADRNSNGRRNSNRT